MCNINVFIKINQEYEEEKKLLDLVSLISNVTSYSYINNNDGDGFYFSDNDYLIKSPKKINVLKFIDDIKKSNFIISHQRIATSGKTDDYLQPFNNNDFVLVHNGILSSFVRKNKSDTFGLFLDFNKEFHRGTEKTREENIIKALQLLLNNSYGSYSICLLDKKTKNLYYFKNSLTNINIFRSNNKKELFITTDKDNKNYLDLYEDFNEIDIKNNQIYRFSLDDKKISINPLEKIEKPDNFGWYTGYETKDYVNSFKKPSFTYTKKQINNHFNFTDEDLKEYNKLEKKFQKSKNKNYNELEKDLNHYQTVRIQDSAQKCYFCNELTHNWCEDYQRYICDECFLEGYN